MTKYFENFKVITYNGSVCLDITQRTVLMNSILSNKKALIPYHVKDGMRAEVIAEKYYGSSDYVWLVYLSNGIIDPYYGWPMDSETFDNFIIDKYGSIESAHSNIEYYRVNWYEDTSKLSLAQYNALEHYKKKYWTPLFDNNGTPTQYKRKEIDYKAIARSSDGVVTCPIDSNELEYWIAVSSYDVEQENNAERAHIKLLDNKLAATAASNLKDLLSK